MSAERTRARRLAAVLSPAAAAALAIAVPKCPLCWAGYMALAAAGVGALPEPLLVSAALVTFAALLTLLGRAGMIRLRGRCSAGDARVDSGHGHASCCLPRHE